MGAWPPLEAPAPSVTAARSLVQYSFMPARSFAVTGRFQPFHNDHLDLVMTAAREGGRLIVGITNPDHRSRVEDPASAHRHRDAANPFSYFERSDMIARALLDSGLPMSAFTIVPFPLEAPALWHNYIPAKTVQLVRTFAKWEHRKVEMLEMGGYTVRTLPGDLQTRISATDIRAALATGGDWQSQVPPGAADVLLSLGADELARRCRASATR